MPDLELDTATLRAIADECSLRADKLPDVEGMTAIAALSRNARRVVLVEMATELRQRALRIDMDRGTVTR